LSGRILQEEKKSKARRCWKGYETRQPDWRGKSRRRRKEERGWKGRRDGRKGMRFKVSQGQHRHDRKPGYAGQSAVPIPDTKKRGKAELLMLTMTMTFAQPACLACPEGKQSA